MSRKPIHEGRLVLDRHRRYCIWEPGRPADQTITLTSGCTLEVWLNREWISGCVEGDGQDYWFFVETGGKFLLAQHMQARYREPE
jgi:hypothetical protein